MIAVTGATGKTGAPTSGLLFARGLAHVRLSSRAGHGDRRFDWLDRSTWVPALAGADALYLVKPPHGSGMAGLVKDLLDAAPGLRRVVLLSEMAREQKPDDDPDRAVERVVEAWDRSWTILRPSWFLQNFSAGGGYHGDVMAGRLSFSTGDAPISWIDTGDVAEVAVAALTQPGHDGRGLTLTGPESYGVSELARRLVEVLDRRISVSEPLDPARLEAMARSGSEREAYLDGLLLDVVAGRFAAVTTDTEDVLGRPPRGWDHFIAAHRHDWN